MSKALKWIDEKKEYIPYDLPNGACLYTDNMEQEIAIPAGQSIQSLVLVMQNAKIATVKTSVLTVGKIPSHYSRVYHTAGGAAFGSAGARYTRGKSG